MRRGCVHHHGMRGMVGWVCGLRAALLARWRGVCRAGAGTRCRVPQHDATFQQNLHEVSGVQCCTTFQCPLLLFLFVFQICCNSFGLVFQCSLPCTKLLERVLLEIGPSSKRVCTAAVRGCSSVVEVGVRCVVLPSSPGCHLGRG